MPHPGTARDDHLDGPQSPATGDHGKLAALLAPGDQQVLQKAARFDVGGKLDIVFFAARFAHIGIAQIEPGKGNKHRGRS
ncbi:hypothetical protein [Sphingomonas sp. CCH10-B3]|uniref:hypothetical protein n=1 Tax=Sphingomonas sp. CCH10-B3 TaxID=1768757 RepID=UPI00082F8930